MTESLTRVGRVGVGVAVGEIAECTTFGCVAVAGAGFGDRGIGCVCVVRSDERFHALSRVRLVLERVAASGK